MFCKILKTAELVLVANEHWTNVFEARLCGEAQPVLNKFRERSNLGHKNELTKTCKIIN